MNKKQKERILKLKIEKSNYTFYKTPMILMQIAISVVYISVIAYLILSNHSIEYVVLFSGINAIWFILIFGIFQFTHAQYCSEIKELELLENIK